MGAGQVGRHLASSLSTKLHEITVIDQSDATADELSETLDVGVVRGNGGSVTTLIEADVAECDLFLALTQNDAINLVSASVAKKLGARRAVSRVHPGAQREEWLFNYREHFQLDDMFSAERLTAVELFKYIRNPEGLLVEDIARGRIEVQQIRVDEATQWLERNLSTLEIPQRIRIALIQRGGRRIFPKGTDTLQNGDLVTLCGRPFELEKFLDIFQPNRASRRQARSAVLIFGGSEYGFTLAQMLENGPYDVRLMESDKQVCEQLAAELNRTVVLHGDATSMQQLREEQISETDFFIGASLDDEDNVMSCLQAKNLGARYCLAIVHRSDYADLIQKNQQQLGILAAVSPRVVTSRELLRFVTAEPFHEVVKLPSGVDLLQVTLQERGSLANSKVSDVKWPDGCGLVGWLREEEAKVPTGADVLEPGDVVYLIAHSSARRAITRLFGA